MRSYDVRSDDVLVVLVEKRMSARELSSHGTRVIIPAELPNYVVIIVFYTTVVRSVVYHLVAANVGQTFYWGTLLHYDNSVKATRIKYCATYSKSEIRLKYF